MISESTVNTGRRLKIITTTGAKIEIERQKTGNEKYSAALCFPCHY